MSLTADDRQKLHQLLHDLRNGRPLGADRAWLRKMVLQHQEARQLYVDAQWMTSAMSWLFKESVANAAATEAVKSQRAAPRPTVLGWLGNVSTSRPLAWSMLVASVLFAAYFTVITWNMWGREKLNRPEIAGREFEASSSSTVATIRESGGAVWRKKSAPKRREPSVSAHERLEIDSGMVRLELKQGTTLVIEGPAEWSIGGANQATLNRGKLVAHVPKQAIGFTLQTPVGNIVDRGTEFGVEVDRQGATDVHVLRGKIEVSPLAGQAVARPPKGQLLFENQSLRISGDQKLQTIGFDAKPFARAQAVAALDKSWSPEQLPGLKLWLRADRGLSLDAAGRVKRWADQSSFGFDAVQPELARRPHRLESGSLHFDGVDDFLSANEGLNLNLAEDSTIFVVAPRLKMSQPSTGIFCLRSRTDPDWNSADGLAITEAHNVQVPQLYVSQGQEYFGKRPATDSLSLHGVWNTDRAALIAVTKKGGTATLRVNRATLAVDSFAIDNRAADGSDRSTALNTAGYMIGARAYDGQKPSGHSFYREFYLAEILMFDRAIVGHESQAVEQYLFTKYPSLSPAPPQLPE